MCKTKYRYIVDFELRHSNCLCLLFSLIICFINCDPWNPNKLPRKLFHTVFLDSDSFIVFIVVSWFVCRFFYTNNECPNSPECPKIPERPNHCSGPRARKFSITRRIRAGFGREILILIGLGPGSGKRKKNRAGFGQIFRSRCDLWFQLNAILNDSSQIVT